MPINTVDMRFFQGVERCEVTSSPKVSHNRPTQDQDDPFPPSTLLDDLFCFELYSYLDLILSFRSMDHHRSRNHIFLLLHDWISNFWFPINLSIATNYS